MDAYILIFWAKNVCVCFHFNGFSFLFFVDALYFHHEIFEFRLRAFSFFMGFVVQLSFLSLSLSFGYFFPQRFQHTFISSNGLYQQQWQRFHSSSSQHFTHKQHSYFTHISIFQQNLNDEISFFCCFMICVCVLSQPDAVAAAAAVVKLWKMLRYDTM